MLILFLVFIVLPVLDIYLLFQVGEIIGGWNLFFLTMAIAALGIALAKSQGRQLWSLLNRDLSRGQMPGDSLIHGAMIFIGGILLVTPGFLSDILGLIFIFPLSRRWLLLHFKQSLEAGLKSGNIRFYGKVYQSRHDGFENESRRYRDVEIIDVTPENHAEIGSRAQHPDSPTNDDNC